MKTVISAKDIEDLPRRGGDVRSLPADAVYTPSARDLLQDLEKGHGTRSGGAGAVSVPSGPLSSKSPTADLETFFQSAQAQNLKEQLCEIGRRLWQRAYVDG